MAGIKLGRHIVPEHRIVDVQFFEFDCKVRVRIVVEVPVSDEYPRGLKVYDDTYGDWEGDVGIVERVVGDLDKYANGGVFVARGNS